MHSIIFSTLLILNAHAKTYIQPTNTAVDRCKNFEVISHRGLSARAPEESKAAYLLAADLHTDYLEMDIHRTKDGVLIATHDDTFERTTNIAEVYPTRVKEPVRNFTYSEIAKLETGKKFNEAHSEFKNEQFIGQKIMKLSDVIEISLNHPNHPGLYIETKSPELYPGYEKDLVDLLNQKKAFGKVKVIFQSFDSKSLERLKALKPEVTRLYLSEASYQDLITKDFEFAKKNAQGIGPDFHLIPQGGMGAYLKGLHDVKLFAHFWTVDDSKDMDQLISAGADGVFTNRTDLLLEACHRSTHEKIEKTIASRIQNLKE